MVTQPEPAFQSVTHSELASLMGSPPASPSETQYLSARPLLSAMESRQVAQVFRSELELPPKASVIHSASDSRRSAKASPRA